MGAKGPANKLSPSPPIWRGPLVSCHAITLFTMLALVFSGDHLTSPLLQYELHLSSFPPSSP